MAFYGSFMERLPRRDPTVGLLGTPAPRVSEVEASIRRNVRAILGSRAGSSPFALDYGLPLFDRVVEEGPQALQRLAEDIAETLRRFEPRLDPEQLRVRAIADPGNDVEPLMLCVEVRGVYAVGNGSGRARFRALVGPEGEVRIAEAR